MFQSNHFIVADDHPLFRGALKQTLTDAASGVRISEAGSLDDVNAIIEADDAVDVVLLDLKMPGVKGFSGLIYLRSQYPDIPVVVVSATEDPQVIRRAVSLGASGFIPKSTTVTVIRAAIKSVLSGEIWVPEDIDLEAAASDEDEVTERLRSLTPQQMRVLMMLREGLLNKQIAYELSVSEATVKAHVSAILQKLNVESRTRAVIVANQADKFV